MNWGLKIGILYGGFVALIISMVMLSMRQRVDLVSKDYYQQELAFQEKIDMVKRTSGLKQALTWEVSNDNIVLRFPVQFAHTAISGDILFYRPSDASGDIKMEISSDTSLLRHFSAAKLHKGLYKMQVNWKAGNEKFYNEAIIQIP